MLSKEDIKQIGRAFGLKMLVEEDNVKLTLPEAEPETQVGPLAAAMVSSPMAAKHINDRKYKIENGRLVKRSTGKPIPEGMPLFILLAQDRKALAALTAYMMVLDTLEMREAVKAAVDDFRLFQEKFPEKMGEPTP